MIREIIYTSVFAREYRKLSDEIRTKAEKREKIFRKNPFDTRLKTHKLKGKLIGFWSFSIAQKYRVIFEFVDQRTVHFHSVGTHDVYQ